MGEATPVEYLRADDRAGLYAAIPGGTTEILTTFYDEGGEEISRRISRRGPVRHAHEPGARQMAKGRSYHHRDAAGEDDPQG